MRDRTELKRLKQEMKALRTEVKKQKKAFDELKQFFSIQRVGKQRQPSLRVRCWGLTVCNPWQPNQTQVVVAGGKAGPFLSMWGRDAKARMILKVDDDVANVALFANDMKEAVDIGVLKEGYGQIGVLDKGSPRAVMRGTQMNTGVVSVVHSDGKVRATMVSTEHEGGEFLAVTPDMKTGELISGNSPNGGFISVNQGNGKAGVIIGCVK